MKRSERSAKSRADAPVFARQATDSWVDARQRTMLFRDVPQERGNRYHAQREKEEPHVLHFEADRVLVGRSLERTVRRRPGRAVKKRVTPAPSSGEQGA
ncbi:MAG TPA: DUF3141 domain-containing protein [Syntrophales bacterium]|nr:DUF3141 domain-containing protein [Syntrophales bacterium]